MDMTREELFNEIMQEVDVSPVNLTPAKKFEVIEDYMTQVGFDARHGQQSAMNILKSPALKELFHDMTSEAIEYLNNQEDQQSVIETRLHIELCNIRFENPDDRADKIVETAYLPALSAYSQLYDSAEFAEPELTAIESFVKMQQEAILYNLASASPAEQDLCQNRLRNLQIIQDSYTDLLEQVRSGIHQGKHHEAETEKIRQRESLRRFDLSKESEEYFASIYPQCGYDDPVKLADMSPYQAFDILGEHLVRQCDWLHLDQDKKLASVYPPVVSDLCKSLAIKAVNFLNNQPDDIKIVSGSKLEESIFSARCIIETRCNLLFMEGKEEATAWGQYRKAEADHIDVANAIHMNDDSYRSLNKGKIPEDAVHTFVKERSKEVNKKLCTTFSHSERQYLRAKKDNLKQIKELHVNKQREALGIKQNRDHGLAM